MPENFDRHGPPAVLTSLKRKEYQGKGNESIIITIPNERRQVLLQEILIVHKTGAVRGKKDKRFFGDNSSNRARILGKGKISGPIRRPKGTPDSETNEKGEAQGVYLPEFDLRLRIK